MVTHLIPLLSGPTFYQSMQRHAFRAVPSLETSRGPSPSPLVTSRAAVDGVDQNGVEQQEAAAVRLQRFVRRCLTASRRRHSLAVAQTCQGLSSGVTTTARPASEAESILAQSAGEAPRRRGDGHEMKIASDGEEVAGP